MTVVLNELRSSYPVNEINNIIILDAILLNLMYIEKTILRDPHGAKS